MGSQLTTTPVEDFGPWQTRHKNALQACCRLLLVSIQLALYVDQAEGMGICFGGGYPACCQGKNTCGPLCASCSRVSEFLRMMMMFGGIGPGTPDVFRTINPDPHKDAGQDAVPFPAAPFPVNGGNRRPRGRGRRPRSLKFPLEA